MAGQTIQPDALPDPRPRYRQGIVVAGGRWLFIAGQVAVDRTGAVVGKGDIDRQARQVFENLRAVLAAAGAGFDQLVMTTTYLTDASLRPAFAAVRADYLTAEPPTSTLVIVKALANEDFLVEIDGIAVL